MRRLNVQFTQIEECIRTALFAVDQLPRNPPLERGEELLLQLTKADAARHNKIHQRVEFALIFDKAVPDPSGKISKEHWPNAGKTWAWILECSETVPTIPFSLEDLELSQPYGGQANPRFLAARDAAQIRPYLDRALDLSLPEHAPAELLSTIRNYDSVLKWAPRKRMKVREHQRRLGESWLSDALKRLYDHKCQVCVHTFEPRYGVPYADTRFLKPLNEGGARESRNLIVLCPNHDAIVRVTKPQFDERLLAFAFPNGLVEKVMLRDHLL